MPVAPDSLLQRVRHHLEVIYANIDTPISTDDVADDLLELMRLDPADKAPPRHVNLWDQADITVITYGDSIRCESEHPLDAWKGSTVKSYRPLGRTGWKMSDISFGSLSRSNHLAAVASSSTANR